MLVYVINKDGKPLMPCSPRKARKLLEAKKAKVIRRTPFTIKLLYGSSGYRQPVIAGMDTGNKCEWCEKNISYEDRQVLMISTQIMCPHCYEFTRVGV